MPHRTGRRLGSRRSSIDHGTARPTMPADARRLAGAALADALRDARATTLARTMDQRRRRLARAGAGGHQPGRLGARPPRLVRRVLDPARSASCRSPTASSPRREAAYARRAGRDLRFGPARPRRSLARRAAVARRARRRGSRRQLDACIDDDPATTRTTTARTTSTASRCSTRTCTARRSPGCARRSAGRRRRAWPCRRCRRASRCAIDGGALALGRAADGARLRVRQRAAGAAGARRAVRDRCDAGEERRVRSPSSTPAATTDADALARRAGAWRARQASSHPARWRRDADGALADALVRSLAAARRRGAGDPRQRLGSRGVLPLGRPPPAERRRVGVGGRRSRASRWGQRRLGVDRRRVPALPRLRRRTVRRLLAAVVRRSSRAARRRVRHPRAPARPRAIATSSSPIATTSSPAFAPPPCQR